MKNKLKRNPVHMQCCITCGARVGDCGKVGALVSLAGVKGLILIGPRGLKYNTEELVISC